MDELQSSLSIHKKNVYKAGGEEHVLRMEGGRGWGGYPEYNQEVVTLITEE